MMKDVINLCIQREREEREDNGAYLISNNNMLMFTYLLDAVDIVIFCRGSALIHWFYWFIVAAYV